MRPLLLLFVEILLAYLFLSQDSAMLSPDGRALVVIGLLIYIVLCGISMIGLAILMKLEEISKGIVENTQVKR